MSGDRLRAVTPGLLDHVGQQRHGQGNAVLHEDLGHVQVHAVLERDGQVVRAVVGALRGHVEHALDAVDLLLDRRGDGLGDVAGAGPRDTCNRPGPSAARSCGYCASGRWNRATPPARVITIDSTDAKIGRSMKNREITVAPPFSTSGRIRARRCIEGDSLGPIVGRRASGRPADVNRPRAKPPAGRGSRAVCLSRRACLRERTLRVPADPKTLYSKVGPRQGSVPPAWVRLLRPAGCAGGR